MLDIMVLILIISMIVIVFLIYRNDRALEYYNDLYKRVRVAANRDVFLGERDVSWRYEELYAVNHIDMVWKFWKPIDSFYKKDPARLKR